MATRRPSGRASLRILAILGAILTASSAWGLTGTVTSDIGVHIREAPRGKILGALPIGSTFEVVSRQGKWLYVRLSDGRTVYVWNPNNENVAGAESLSDGAGVAPIATVERRELPPPVVGAGEGETPRAEERPTTVVDDTNKGDRLDAVPLPSPAPRDYIANGNYRLRAGPGTNARVITTLDAGRSKMRVIDRSGDWLKVRTTDGKVGWVHGSGATEASACIDGRCARPSANPAKDDAADILAAAQNDVRSTPGAGNACVRSEILKAAKNVVRNQFGNRSRSKGQCAYGVRRILDKAGLNNGGGLGHAIDYHARGTLARKGFVNKIGRYNAYNAPPGAILVFSGPYTKNYLRNGRMSRPYGNYVGHITVKGDDGRYYTDGRTVDPAIANRYLVGVYVPENTSRMPASIRRKCQ